MLSSALKIGAALLALTGLAACGGSNSTTALLYTGVTSQMQQPDTGTRAVDADRYFRIMCERGAIDSSASGACAELRLSQDQWRRLVYASMNDIDERCDMYIEALDEARRDNEAIGRQIKLIRDTTTAIVALADPTSAVAITVLNEAFSLAESSSNNYFSQMLLTLENGTVYGVVKKQQSAYRKALTSHGYIRKIYSKPTAYFAIRGYLRLCLPSTIESEVNSAIADVQYLGDARSFSISVNPDLASLSAVPKTPETATDLVDRWNRGTRSGGGDGGDGRGDGGNGGNGGSRAAPRPLNAITEDEKLLTFEEAKGIQERLCVSATGDFGQPRDAAKKTPPSATRRAVEIYEAINGRVVDGLLGVQEISGIEATRTCDELRTGQSGPGNAFEKLRYYEPNGNQNDAFAALQRELNLIVAMGRFSEKVRANATLKPALEKLFPVPAGEGRTNGAPAVINNASSAAPQSLEAARAYKPTLAFDGLTRLRIKALRDLATESLKTFEENDQVGTGSMSIALDLARDRISKLFCRIDQDTCNSLK